MTSVRVFQRFRNDHRRVLARLDEIERVLRHGRAGRLGRRAEVAVLGLVTLLAAQFATHMRAEEEVLYPALEQSFPESAPSLGPLRSDHRELRGMLESLDRLLAQAASPARDEQVSVQVRDFVDLLRIHIHKEEAAVFRVAARVLTPQDLQQLAERIAAHHGHRSRSRAASTRIRGSMS